MMQLFLEVLLLAILPANGLEGSTQNTKGDVAAACPTSQQPARYP